MELDRLGPEARQEVQEIVGYLNFSSGTPDVRFLQNLNGLFARLEAQKTPRAGRRKKGPAGKPAWQRVAEVISEGIKSLRETSEAFRQLDQAEMVARLVFDELLPAYRRFHRDLLFHQTDEALLRPFFIGRACEAVLAQGPPWQDAARIVPAAIKRLNDFIGHRPVAVLETRQKIQPYEHEWVRPIPLYIAGAGTATGRYHDLVDRALEILRATDPDLLRQAWFDPNLLDELAMDPRAFDFDHPNNRRLNYHFGCWDPHLIDQRGFYRRFVLQQVTLDAMLARVGENKELSYEEVLFEAAAVLAGTVLMGSGVSGSGPDAHDSSTTMATLLPHIAAYRDAFYEHLMSRVSGAHAERLRAEAAALQQPFGGARQDLNQRLAQRRAEQLQHVHLAILFARMGYTEAAVRQVRKVPVASARMRCDIDCRLSLAHQAIDRQQLDEAAERLPEIEDILHRAIECGALVDPWNILGFGGQYSLFPSLENSIPDHRVDELLDLMSDLFDLYARLEKEAAAAGEEALQAKLSGQLKSLAQWWDRFASTEVGGVGGVSGQEAWESADDVSEALGAWHRAGPAAGNIAFWRQHVERFTSPKAFALLTEALLEQRDLVAAMALLVSWLSRAEEIPLVESDYSFYALALRWMENLWQPEPRTEAPIVDDRERWSLTRKFLDYLEANADEYWHVPQLELGNLSVLPADFDEQDEGEEDEEEVDEEPEGLGEDEEDDLYSAAYENVIYRDSTDDGFESDMLEGGELPTDFELAAEAERLSDRLSFLNMLARLWKLPAAMTIGTELDESQRGAISSWLARAVDLQRGLADLLAAVHRYRVPAPRSNHDAMVEYARRLGIKEMLLERVIAACVDMADSRRLLLVAARPKVAGEVAAEASAESWEAPSQRVLAAMFRGDVATVRRQWGELLKSLAGHPLCYNPVSRGGNPQRIVTCRSLHRLLRRLLEYAPKLGLLTETVRLIATVEGMERHHPVGPGALTEFDRLFEIGARGVFQSIVFSAENWTKTQRQADVLVECLGRAIKPLLERWLAYTANVRISVLETVNDESRWESLKRFIQRYGGDLFTQRFMNPGNLRAILYQGADSYLEALAEEPDAEDQYRLLEELDKAVPRQEAVRWLELAVAAVAENYTEYVDYNTTTTQSDHGEMLYTLLDFLRLRANYDRVAWSLHPLVIAHKVIVRSGNDEAAALLRREVAAHNAPAADRHLQRYQMLTKRYGMRLPSIADRLGERFVRPLAIDRICALVRPAIEELKKGQPRRAFEQLEQEVAWFTEQPSGAGFDVPTWLEALEDEVQRVRAQPADDEGGLDFFPSIKPVRLTRSELERQIARWEDDDWQVA